MEYSLYKTVAAKYRITMTKAKLKYTKNKEFRVPYKTQRGVKYAVFYNDGFRKVKYALGGYVDVIPEYEQMNKPKRTVFSDTRRTSVRCAVHMCLRLRYIR